MLAIIESVSEKGDLNIKKGVSLTYVRIFGMKVLKMSILLPDILSDRKKLKRLEYASENLLSENITRVIFHSSFSERNFFFNKNIYEASGRYLFECIAGDAAGKIGGRCAAFFSKRLYPREEQALLKLCARFKSVLVKVEYGGEHICRNMRNRLGLAVIEDPSPAKLLEADVAVLFDEPKSYTVLSDSCVVVAIEASILNMLSYKKSLVSVLPELDNSLTRTMPEGYDKSALLSEALIRGAVDQTKLKIDKLRLGTNGLTVADKVSIIP